ncbi:MAG: heparinase II/III family protein [Planctomycetes bacterium]|nr:heparinase II/III family protein [Planctomycetota bacterium]
MRCGPSKAHLLNAALASLLCVAACSGAAQEIPKAHPRLFGSLAQLQALKQARPDAYKNMVANAKDAKVFDFTRMPAMALVCAIDGDQALGKEAVKLALNYVNGPIKVGHVTFGHDLALCAMVYDLCHECWTEAERQAFIAYMNKTVDANVNSEIYPFANGYYGYKNWGIGLACYATLYENPKAPEYLKTLLDDYKARACPALDLAGEGGGWAEGHYVNYWTYEWTVFCEVSRLCGGVDLYEMAPKFFRNRAVASMFEMYPGALPHELNRPVPMGDGGYGEYGGFSEKILGARRILCGRYRDDPAHAFASAYNLRVPGCCIPEAYSYMNFLWNDTTLPTADLKSFKLSHFSAGPGWVAARSSWDGDSTYFMIRFGDRYTAHQHLDVGHFLIFKHEQLAGDGGVYDAFGGQHDSNYYLRSIAHNTLLVLDPAEKFEGGPGIRAAGPSLTDGGQAYPWLNTDMGHNGNVLDVNALAKDKPLSDIADVLAYEDKGAYVYVAGDATRAYSKEKLDLFTRQAVYLRPNTVVLFDRVQAKNPAYKKTWLLQALKTPTEKDGRLVVTNGKGRMFVQTLLPADPAVKLCKGADLYSYGGKTFTPAKNENSVPECRVEISPKSPAAFDCFLHVLTVCESSVEDVPKATVKNDGASVTVTVGGATLHFQTGSVAATIDLGAGKTELANRIMPDPTAGKAGASPATAASAAASTATASSSTLKIPAAVTKTDAEPTAEEKKASGERYADLKKKVLESLNGGRKETVYLNVFGQQNRVKLLSGDEKALKVEFQGNKLDVLWKDISPKQFYGIASIYSEDSKALYAYCVGEGLRDEAQQILMRQ